MSRLLIAGIGNIFLGDDAFGVEVARACAQRAWPAGVEVRDFGVRCLDLALRLLDGWDLIVVADAVARGGAPGTLYDIAFEPSACPTPELDAHRVGVDQVVAWAHRLGGGGAGLPPIRLIGCEPHAFEMGALSPPVEAAVAPAVEMIERVVAAHLEAAWRGHEQSGPPLPTIEARPPSDQRERPKQKVAEPLEEVTP